MKYTTMTLTKIKTVALVTTTISLCLFVLLLSDKTFGATYDGKWYATLTLNSKGYYNYSGPLPPDCTYNGQVQPVSTAGPGFVQIGPGFYSASLWNTSTCVGTGTPYTPWVSFYGGNPIAQWSGGSGATIYHRLPVENPGLGASLALVGITPATFDPTKMINCPDSYAETAFLATCPGGIGSYDCATQTGECAATPCSTIIDADLDGFSQCEDCDDGDSTKTTQCISSDKPDQQQGSAASCPPDQGGQGQ